MQLRDGSRLFSATDLVGFLECEHLTGLDLVALQDDAARAQKSAPDDSSELYARKGNEHERAYLTRLRAEGREVMDIAVDGGSTDDKVTRTLAAMRSGVDVIYQATLRDGPLFGHADFLRRVDDQPSPLGAWRYEVADTKLARSPKAKFLVQMAFYSHLVSVAQGAEPRLMHVVLGDSRGVEHAMTHDNILVMAPYKVQVNLLKRMLPYGARVGTVDKFQGQEAELVILSMTTSSEEDLPRNIEFLYSKNRLNVAVSRAKCLAIVVANPALMAIKCKTPEQMAMVNTLCWLAEQTPPS